MVGGGVVCLQACGGGGTTDVSPAGVGQCVGVICRGE